MTDQNNTATTHVGRFDRRGSSRAGDGGAHPRHLASLHALAAELSRSATIRDVIDVVMTNGMRALGAAGGGVRLLAADGTVEYEARYPGPVPAADADGHDACITAPLTLGDRVLGVIAFQVPDRRDFGNDDRELLLTLAHHCAQGLDRARLSGARCQMEDALRQAEAARREAEHANQAKSQFLAAMSHELRTPLNAIQGHLQLIELGVHGPVTGSQRATLERVQRSQRALQSLINDVLNFARIEAGRVEYLTTRVVLADVVGFVLAMVRPQLDARPLHVTASVARDLAAQADVEKVQQILLNLLSNALKFTHAGGQVAIDAIPDPRGVALRVSDNGRGIPPERLEQIFDPFVQLHRELPTAAGGLGLGLSISRDLARGMSGDLLVESVVGRGSTFSLVLPRAPA